MVGESTQSTVDTSLSVDETSEHPRRRRRLRTLKKRCLRIPSNLAKGSSEESVRGALKHTMDFCNGQAELRHESGRKWELRSRYLGIPATLLAAIAGTTALADQSLEWVVAGSALTAAAVGGVMSSLNPEKKSQQRYQEAGRFEQLARHIAVLLYVDHKDVKLPVLRGALELVLGQIDELQNLSASRSFVYRQELLESTVTSEGFRGSRHPGSDS
jgi:hypothetical protein